MYNLHSVSLYRNHIELTIRGKLIAVDYGFLLGFLVLCSRHINCVAQNFLSGENLSKVTLEVRPSLRIVYHY